jgi:Tfp pilus assembly protein PilN
MRSKISLLPDEFKRRNKLKKQMYYIITTVATLSIILAGIVSMIILYRLTLKSSLTSLNEQRQFVSQQITSLKQYEDLDKKINNLESLVKNATSKSTDWRSILIKISNSLPGGVNISEFVTTSIKEGKQIKIKGSSIDNYSLGLWISNLRGINELKNVQCISSEKKKNGNSIYVEYDITAQIPSLPENTSLQAPSSKEVKK